MNSSRLMQLVVGDVPIALPVYFPSISSIKTAMLPLEYLKFLASASCINNKLLVSAFDLAKINDKSEVNKILKKACDSGVTVLFDSGNYESFWMGAQKEWTQKKFHDVLGCYECHLAFGFDEQDPPQDLNEHLDLIVKNYEADVAATSAIIIPIVHGSRSDIPRLCSSVVNSTHCQAIAVPERKLGDGLLQRAETVRDIRQALSEGGHDVALHLLGTGNPISMAVYAVMGADSFDGLEWCQTVVDHDTGLLYHLSQADFFAEQTKWGATDLSFHARTLAHNLEFYTEWMGRLRRGFAQDNVRDFLKFNIPQRALYKLEGLEGWPAP